MQHKGNYRNKKILAAAIDVPVCFGCGEHNAGQVVAAHANWLEYGKGRGIKAGDNFIAYLCHACHHQVDEGIALSKQEKKEFWNRAHIKSMEWIFNNGIVK
jgi:hypothetical protein